MSDAGETGVPETGVGGTGVSERAAAPPAIDAATLHAALDDPVLGSLGFLNEVMGRYPEAISFAPGAPHLLHLDALELGRYVERYVEHLCRARGIDARRARRLLYEYGPSRGLINDLVADALHRDHAIAVPPEAVVVTVGAQEALLVALRALCRTGSDLLAVADPCYVGVVGAARLLDIGVVAVADTGHGPDIDALHAACGAARAAGRRVRALYVAPDFANPGGGVVDLPTRRRLLAAAECEDLYLIEDSAYGFTAASGAPPPLKALDDDARVLYVGTFAKVCLPGARVGFVVADQRVAGRPAALGRRLLADELAAVKSMVTVNTSPICQAVIGGMLLAHGGSLAALGRRRAPLYRRNLRLLLQALDRHAPPSVTWNRPSGGFFVRVRLPVPADIALLERSAAEYGVVWTPMAPFHVGDGGANELRLSCSYLDPNQIEDGAVRLARLFRGLAPR